MLDKHNFSSINQQIQTNASMPHQVFCPINQQIRSTAPITTQAQPLTNVIVNGKACGEILIAVSLNFNF
jgi:hypothetical protein